MNETPKPFPFDTTGSMPEQFTASTGPAPAPAAPVPVPINAPPSVNNTLTLSLTATQADFLLYSLGYMLSSAYGMSDTDEHKGWICEHHDTIRPKLIECKNAPPASSRGLMQKARLLCYAIEDLPASEQQTKISLQASELSRLLHGVQ